LIATIMPAVNPRENTDAAGWYVRRFFPAGRVGDSWATVVATYF
jgi:hypothetical protein